MTQPKRKYQNRQKQTQRRSSNSNRTTNKDRTPINIDSQTSTKTTEKRVDSDSKQAKDDNERTPLIPKSQPVAGSSFMDPNNENSASYHEQMMGDRGENVARLLVQSSDSSSAMSTYGTATETVIEKTLQRLNSISRESETIGEKDPLLEVPATCHKDSTLIDLEKVHDTSSPDNDMQPMENLVSTPYNDNVAGDESQQPSLLCDNRRFRDNDTNKRKDQFAKQPLFSSLTMSNEFQLISSSDMKMNFNMLISQQQKNDIMNDTSHCVYDNRQDIISTTGHIRNQPPSSDRHRYHQSQAQSYQDQNTMTCSHLFNIYIKPTILGLLITICFILTTFGNTHFTEADGVLWSAFTLIFMYILIIFELVHRTLSAIIGAVLAVTVYSCLKQVPSLEEIVTWVNIETLTLLFGMMIIVAVLSETGIFNYMAIWSYKKSRGRFWLLLAIMYIVTAVLSAFIDNVSTMLFMAPIIIRLSDLQQMDPRLVLMILMVVSNIGGLATPVGDPPNIIVVSDELMRQQGVNFVDFVYICTPAVIIIMVITFIYIKLRYRNVSSFRYNRPLAVVELEHEIDIWTKIQDHLPKLTKDHVTVRGNINNQINQLKTCLNKKLYYEEPVGLEGIVHNQYHTNIGQGTNEAAGQHQRNMNDDLAFDNTIKDLEDRYAIKDCSVLILPSLVLVITIILFFLQSFPWSHLNSLAWISLFAGITLLAFNSSSKPQNESTKSEGSVNHTSDYGFDAILAKIEWSTLIFFAALFIVMEVASKLGLIFYIGQKIIQMINLLPDGDIRSLGAITIVLWSSGIASAIIDNVPFTAMMVKVLGTMILEQQQRQSMTLPTDSTIDSILPMRAMVFALLFGACLGGNGTLIGASANLVTAGVAERFGYPIGFNQFLKFALPITIISLIIANAYLIILFGYIM